MNEGYGAAANFACPPQAQGLKGCEAALAALALGTTDAIGVARVRHSNHFERKD